MEMSTKYLARTDWPRILRRSTAWGEVAVGDFRAVTNLIYFHETAKPLVVREAGKIVDNGYAWVHILPEDENWCLTVMFDDSDKLTQYYFDITLQNVVDGENSYFCDLFLDVTILPDGRITLLDEDELDEALAEGTITAAQAQLARDTATMLMRELPANIARLETFCVERYAELSKNLK